LKQPSRREPARVRLIHWKTEEAEERGRRISALGYDIDASVPYPPAFLREMQADPPDAIVVDLSRLPSQGRDLALALRERPASRAVPVVFVGGESERVERVRALLSDATFATWDDVADKLKHAIENPPKNPIVRNRMDGYAETPLARKLGVKPGELVALLSAPDGFEQKLGALPEGAAVTRRASKRTKLTLYFAATAHELEARASALSRYAEEGGIWILWPKAAAKRKTDLTQVVVRRVAESVGLVDYKIASIDDTWSGLKFTKEQREASKRTRRK
jgi:CheY-like chemotaxis protein